MIYILMGPPQGGQTYFSKLSICTVYILKRTLFTILIIYKIFLWLLIICWGTPLGVPPLQNIHNITSIKKVELDETILEFANCFTSFVFYFPYILDWRGRIYPNVTYSHHHSVLAKLLIHFHYKEPLNDKGFLALQLGCPFRGAPTCRQSLWPSVIQRRKNQMVPRQSGTYAEFGSEIYKKSQ